MKNHCDIYITSNGIDFCHSCSHSEICSEFKKCFDHKLYIMWGEMASIDDNLRCVEKWRLYNE